VTDHHTDTTITTSDTATLFDTHNKIIPGSLPSALHQPEELATNDIPENFPSPEPKITISLDSDREGTKRNRPPRSPKTKAMEQILAMTNSIPDDAREIQDSQLPHVQLCIGQSTVKDAGTGLFLLHGPQPDGTAHVGDR